MSIFHGSSWKGSEDTESTRQIYLASTSEIKAGKEQFDHEVFFRIFCSKCCRRQINKMRIPKTRAVTSCHQKIQQKSKSGKIYLGIVELFIYLFNNHFPASISNWYNFKYYLFIYLKFSAHYLQFILQNDLLSSKMRCQYSLHHLFHAHFSFFLCTFLNPSTSKWSDWRMNCR